MFLKIWEWKVRHKVADPPRCRGGIYWKGKCEITTLEETNCSYAPAG